MYSQHQIQSHIQAAKKLDRIKDLAFDYIRKNIGKITEYDVQQFIKKEFKKEKLATAVQEFIVGVNQNSAMPHYFPQKRSKLITRNSLALIDIWGRNKRRGSVFADITWVGYCGQVPDKIQKVFDKVICARDLILEYIKQELKNGRLPKAGVADFIARDYFRKFQDHQKFIHKTGHSLGVISPHGKHFRLSAKSRKELKADVPFTIEPGLYFKNEFGIRSEINCYLTRDFKLKITTQVQKNIIKL